MLRDELLSRVPPAGDIPPLAVPTPEWADFDGKLFCRSVSPADLDDLVKADKKEPGSWKARYASLVIGDEHGRRVFRDEDHAWLSARGNAVIERFCEAGAAQRPDRGVPHKFFEDAKSRGRRWFAAVLIRTLPGLGGMASIPIACSARLRRNGSTWRTAYELSPWGDDRTDEAVGRLIGWLIAVNGGKPKEPEDYMPHLRRQKPPAEPMDEGLIVKAFEALAKAAGRGELILTGPA